ncbi:MAG TPA: GC-type dockerin domain-anchored protein [Phycisphaerales bacterium]|nr:GC-type dockerin domain-anchored protein [Phycisphaerales bacterium]
MNTPIRLAMLAALSCAAVAPQAPAQWSANAAANLVLADRTGEQVQPKIAPVPAAHGGGAYVAWFDNSTGGYDVYLQRVNAQGVEQWAHNGVLIADRSVSSTVDYSLACDADGNAVIVFNDDRTTPQQITLQKVSPAGTPLFNGSAGVNVGAGSTGGSPPTVAVLADGNYGVIWNSTTSPIATNMQKVNAATGALLWNAGAPITQADWLAPARWVQASDCQSDGAGGMIVLFVRCTGSSCVTSNKQLHAQRYNALGAPQWGSGTPVTIFGGTSSIQTATYPRFIADGAGGGVFGWYENGSARNAYIQHVLADGSLKFTTPLVANAVNGARIRVGVGFTYNRATGEYFAAFDEADSGTQSNHTINVQRFNPAGLPQWGANGVSLLGPDGFFQSSFIQVRPSGDGCIVSWIWLDNTSQGYVYAAGVSGESSVLFNQQVSSTFESKSRLTSALGSCGDPVMLAFGAGNPADINVQNVNATGVLGPGTCPMFAGPPPMARRPCLGATITITGAPTGDSTPCVHWRKDGTPLADGPRISGAATPSLTITGVLASDAGTYDAVAANTCGTLASAPTPVSICRPDYNCSGALEVQDIFDFLNGWLGGDPRADYNGGGLSVQDIFDFLNGWLAGC